MPPKKKSAKPVFEDLVFTFAGASEDVQDAIESNGGTLAVSVTKKVTYVVAVKSQVDKKTAKIKAAEKRDDVSVVSEAFIYDSVKKKKLQDPSKYGFDDSAVDDKPAAKGKKKAEADPKDSGKGKASTSKAGAGEAKKSPAGESKKRKKPEPPPNAESEEESEDDGDDDDDKQMRTDVVKGGAAVDSVYPNAADYHVHQSNGVVYDALLNQTNIQNNNNKFYILQVLVNDDPKKGCVFWTRWGRVGENGQNSSLSMTVDQAIAAFKKKFSDKTSNSWDNRKNFVAKAGKYTLLERDYGANNNEDDGKKKKKPKKEVEKKKSTLDPRVQHLVKSICNLSMMKDEMMSLGYDAKKLPLGKLTKRHIEQGYDVLKELYEAVNKGQTGSYSELSSRFYTIIPHDFGRRVPQVLNTVQMVKKKLEMLDTLADIEIAATILKKADEVDDSEDPVDVNYRSLKADIVALDDDSEEVKMIKKYTAQTHGKTHNNYTLEVGTVFALDRDGEAGRFKPFTKQRRQLLWHGSRMSNYMGIISQGLRIAPPEAPVTGYMFGKGIYFADSVSKSANYCWTSRANNTGYMILCDVAIGKQRELYNADYHADKLPKGCLSTKGVGRNQPDPKDCSKTADGAEIPWGTLKDVNDSKAYLQYNEHIVYSVDQVRMKYLITMKFKYK